MNKRLVFSWANTFMLAALIYIGFATFEGMSFYSGGSFTLSLWATAFVCLAVFIVFFVAQQLKGGALNFGKWIWVERFLVFPVAPFFLLLAMAPVSHYLNIQRQGPQIVNQFACAVDTAKAMFVEYEAYTDQRLRHYDHRLRQRPALDRQNRLRALQLQLRSANYDSLRTSALRWIEASIAEPSTHDVFLLGNIDEIKQAIGSWNGQLAQMASRRMSDEDELVAAFDVPSVSAGEACRLLDGLSRLYRSASPGQLASADAAVTMLWLWLLLMLPYLFQKRHSKSDQTLTGSKRVAENRFLFYW